MHLNEQKKVLSCESADSVGAGAPAHGNEITDDAIQAEIDRILTDELIAVGEQAISGWVSDEPGVVATIAFEAMWRAMRTSQKMDIETLNTLSASQRRP